MNSDGNKILDAIKRMAADDNKGLRMSTTIVDVKDDPRGSIVGFGTEKDCGDDAKAQTIGLPGKYMACAFFIDREELKNTYKQTGKNSLHERLLHESWSDSQYKR